jgi:hypothetical protein
MAVQIGEPILEGGTVTIAAMPASVTTIPGASAPNALAVQGVTGGVAVPISGSTTVSGTVTALPSGTTTVAGTVTTAAGSINTLISQPTSSTTLSGGTTAYSANQLMANSTVAASVTVPSFNIGTAAGGAIIPSLDIVIADSVATSWGGQTVQVDLWSAAPTFTNGDRGTYAVATGYGAGVWIDSFSGTFPNMGSTGVATKLVPALGNFAVAKLGSGTAVFWTLHTLTGSGVTGASAVVTVQPILLQ